MNWATFITAGVGVWSKKALASLGFGLVSYGAYIAAFTSLKTSLMQAWGGVWVEVAAFLALAGFVEAIGILLGGISATVALLAFKRLGVMQS